MKPILDPCCGGRMFWFDKHNPAVLYCDNRYETVQYPNEPGRTMEIAPDIIADFRSLPFEDEVFYHVVFDPPHLTRNAGKSRMAGIYGTLPKDDWQSFIRDGFNECMRVLKPFGTLIFKWNELDIPTTKIIEAIGHKPLYGHRSGKASKTHWMAFVKLEEER